MRNIEIRGHNWNPMDAQGGMGRVRHLVALNVMCSLYAIDNVEAVILTHGSDNILKVAHPSISIKDCPAFKSPPSRLDQEVCLATHPIPVCLYATMNQKHHRDSGGFSVY